jgi:hypothetical protein
MRSLQIHIDGSRLTLGYVSGTLSNLIKGVDSPLTSHLGLLGLKVGCAIDEAADDGVVVERREEILRLPVRTDLGEL